MNPLRRFLPWTLVLALAGAAAAWAAGPDERPDHDDTGGGRRSAAASVDVSPGAEASRTLSQVTGIAISPLVGTAGVGAWRYLRAPEGERDKLPWYAQPWFWVPALIVVGLCALKDTSGVVLPPGLKKPFDILELFENKVSGLVATGAIVPIALKTFKAMDGPSALHGTAGHWAAMDLSWLGNLAIAPLALVVYGAVWLVSHTVHVFIALSPFGALDAALKSGRAALLASVVGTQWLHSGLGALWAGLIAAVCLVLAPWAFRLMVMGSAFGWDTLTFRRRRFAPSPAGNPAFAARRIGKARSRTLGVLARNPDGGLSFVWRPWLLLPARTETLSKGAYWLGDGAFYNEIQRDADGAAETVFLLPPRCNGHEQALATLYGFQGVRPAGLRALWAWFRSLFTGSHAPA